MYVRLVKSFTFEAAHWLPTFPEGHKCRRMHGHSFHVEVIAEGDCDESLGYLVDYGDIKRATEPIEKALDHYCLNEIKGLENPTSEMIAKWIWERLRPALPLLSEVVVHETCSSRCHYKGAGFRGQGSGFGVKLAVQHDASALSRLVGASPPTCAGLVLSVPPSGDALASVVEGNPLADDFAFDVELPGSRIVLWSGNLSDELFGEDPRTWMRPGHEALRAFCDAAAPVLIARRHTIAFRPHARHVINDVQSALNFLRERAGQPFELALAPADLLTVDMLKDAEDHLTRACTALGPRAALFFLHDVKLVGGSLTPAPIGTGVLPSARLVALVREHVPATTPIVLMAQDLGQQLQLLETL